MVVSLALRAGTRNCTDVDAFQCYAYTEVRAVESSGRGGAAGRFTSAEYRPPPTDEFFQSDWFTGWVTKFHAGVKAELNGVLPVDVALPSPPDDSGEDARRNVPSGVFFNVSLAYSTCSGTACWEQYLFDEAGVPPKTVTVEATWITRAQLNQPSPPPPPARPSPPPSPPSNASTALGSNPGGGGDAGDGMGAALASDASLGILLAVLLAMALSLFGAFELAVPRATSRRLDAAVDALKRSAPRTRFFLQGLVFGLVASPCTGPFALSILVYVAQSGGSDGMALGFAALLLFGLGLGTLLLLAAVSVGILARLPAPGPWLRDVKRHGGFVVLIMACTLVASRLDGAALAACFWGVASAWWGYIALTWHYVVVPWDEAPFEMLMQKDALRPFSLLRRFPALVPRREMIRADHAAASDGGGAPGDAADRRIIVDRRRRTLLALALVVCVLIGTYMAWSWSASGEVDTWPPSVLIHGPRTDLRWYDEWEAATAAANETGAAMMVVFKADWCAPCRAMEYGPLRSAAVTAAATRVTKRSTVSGSSATGSSSSGGGVPLGAPPLIAVRLDITRPSTPGAVLKRDVWGIAATPATAFVTAAAVAAADAPSAVRPSTVLEHYQGEAALVEAIEATRAGRSLGSVGNGGKGAARGGGEFGESLSDNVAAGLALCYLWGLLASLTPCFYPMIPTTIALFSAAADRAEDPGGGAAVGVEVEEAAAAAAQVGDCPPGNQPGRWAGADGDVERSADEEKAGAVGRGGNVGRSEVVLRAVLYVMGLALTYACLGLAIAAGTSNAN